MRNSRAQNSSGPYLPAVRLPIGIGWPHIGSYIPMAVGVVTTKTLHGMAPTWLRHGTNEIGRDTVGKCR